MPGNFRASHQCRQHSGVDLQAKTGGVRGAVVLTPVAAAEGAAVHRGAAVYRGRAVVRRGAVVGGAYVGGGYVSGGYSRDPNYELLPGGGYCGGGVYRGGAIFTARQAVIIRDGAVVRGGARSGGPCCPPSWRRAPSLTCGNRAPGFCPRRTSWLQRIDPAGEFRDTATSCIQDKWSMRRSLTSASFAGRMSFRLHSLSPPRRFSPVVDRSLRQRN